MVCLLYFSAANIRFQGSIQWIYIYICVYLYALIIYTYNNYMISYIIYIVLQNHIENTQKKNYKYPSHLQGYKRHGKKQKHVLSNLSISWQMAIAISQWAPRPRVFCHHGSHHTNFASLTSQKEKDGKGKVQPISTWFWMTSHSWMTCTYLNLVSGSGNDIHDVQLDYLKTYASLWFSHLILKFIDPL